MGIDVLWYFHLGYYSSDASSGTGNSSDWNNATWADRNAAEMKGLHGDFLMSFILNTFVTKVTNSYINVGIVDRDYNFAILSNNLLLSNKRVTKSHQPNALFPQQGKV